MNPHHKDTAVTITVAITGFVTQMTNLELLFKMLIGLAALIFVLARVYVFVLKNWDAFRHPGRFAREYRRRRKLQNKKSSDEEESTTV